MKKLFGFLLIALFLLIPTFAHSANWNVSFKWATNVESDLAGYRIYSAITTGGQVIGQGNELLDIAAPNVQGTVSMPDGDYYFVLTAYDISGNESVTSAEIHEVLDGTAPGAPSNFVITIILKLVP